MADTELIAAAEAVIARWDSPKWKDEAPTADYIARLRRAVEASRRASPAAAVPEDALPPLPKGWEDRIGAPYKGKDINDIPYTAQIHHMKAEIAEWRARAAVEADRAQYPILQEQAATMLAQRKKIQSLEAALADRAQQGEPVDERTEFEAWIKSRIGYPFAGAFTSLMWDAWQARAATKAAAPADAPREQSLTLTAAEHGTMPTRIQAALDLLADATLPRHVFVAVSNVLHACNDELFRAAPLPDTGIPTAGEVEGWKWVPVEPTEGMIRAACLNQATLGTYATYEDWWNDHTTGISEKIRAYVAGDYRVMIGAAPVHPGEGEGP